MNEFTSCKDCENYVENKLDGTVPFYCIGCIHFNIRVDNFKPKPKKVELKDGSYTFDIYGDVTQQDIKYQSQLGYVRQTEEQAEIASQAMLRRNKLSALAETVGSKGEKIFEHGGSNFYVCYIENNEWCIVEESDIYNPEIVYMSEETASKVKEALEEGLFIL